MTYRDSDYMPGASYFFLGLAAGSALALLFAPMTGEETRGRIRQGIEEGKNKVMEGVNEGKKFVNRAAGRVENAAQEGREAYNRA
jgi:gas vesicle protein